MRGKQSGALGLDRDGCNNLIMVSNTEEPSKQETNSLAADNAKSSQRKIPSLKKLKSNRVIVKINDQLKLIHSEDRVQQRDNLATPGPGTYRDITGTLAKSGLLKFAEGMIQIQIQKSRVEQDK